MPDRQPALHCGAPRTPRPLNSVRPSNNAGTVGLGGDLGGPPLQPHHPPATLSFLLPPRSPRRGSSLPYGSGPQAPTPCGAGPGSSVEGKAPQSFQLLERLPCASSLEAQGTHPGARLPHNCSGEGHGDLYFLKPPPQ